MVITTKTTHNKIKKVVRLLSSTVQLKDYTVQKWETGQKRRSCHRLFNAFNFPLHQPDET
jgi:hypothetical protein